MGLHWTITVVTSIGAYTAELEHEGTLTDNEILMAVNEAFGGYIYGLTSIMALCKEHRGPLRIVEIVEPGK